jgi:histidine triad (HIT) family protein
LFCRIVSGEVPAEILHEDAEILAFRDINPQAPHHILVVPRKHMDSLLQVEEGDMHLLGRMHQVVAQLARQNGLVDEGFRVVVNTGPAGGQTVGHLHFHLLGGRDMRWPPG